LFATHIVKCGERQWRAMPFLLERRFPQRWGRRPRPPTDAQPPSGPEPKAGWGWPPGFHPSRLSAQEQELLLKRISQGCDQDGGEQSAKAVADLRSEAEWNPYDALYDSVLMERTLQDPDLSDYSQPDPRTRGAQTGGGRCRP
jgi:hypothetical protein